MEVHRVPEIFLEFPQCRPNSTESLESFRKSGEERNSRDQPHSFLTGVSRNPENSKDFFGLLGREEPETFADGQRVPKTLFPINNGNSCLKV